MSDSVFPLTTPRARPSPVIPLQNSATASSQLLYDLPPSVSFSPPTSPRSSHRIISPASPTLSARSTSPPTRNGGRTRSTTPSRAAHGDLEQFANHCRLWYFNQDEEAGKTMTQILTTIPNSQKAPYIRIQASMRSAFHKSVSARRIAEFRAHLNATQPGGSLLPHLRNNPHSPMAKKERFERFQGFIRSWCKTEMPGPQPFFKALWAMMRLQILPPKLGGAGRNRIHWELDDAVFRETAGKDFMLEAIDILKGVLAFEEVSSPKNLSRPASLASIHSRSISQPLTSPAHTDQPDSSLLSKRPRAPSDPFLDRPVRKDTLLEEPIASPRSDTLLDDPEDEYLRIWLSPDLSNPEYTHLLSTFPSFITKCTIPRFPTGSHRDLEEGTEDDYHGVSIGTGTMWISSKPRQDGWEGSLWTRIIQWFRRLFS